MEITIHIDGLAMEIYETVARNDDITMNMNELAIHIDEITIKNDKSMTSQENTEIIMSVNGIALSIAKQIIQMKRQ